MPLLIYWVVFHSYGIINEAFEAFYSKVNNIFRVFVSIKCWTFQKVRRKVKSDIINARAIAENEVASNPFLPNSMIYKDSILSDLGEILNLFASYFQEFYIQSGNFFFLTNEIINMPHIISLIITEDTVLRFLKKFKSKLTTRPDGIGIPYFLLKTVHMFL